jgi:hypothetical protein
MLTTTTIATAPVDGARIGTDGGVDGAAPSRAESERRAIRKAREDELVERIARHGVIHIAPRHRTGLDDLLAPASHDPRSAYAERFWLGVLGPSSLWLLRAMVHGLESAPTGFAADTNALSRTLGLGDRIGRQSPLVRAMARLAHFDLAHATEAELHVSPLLPWLDARQVRRLPSSVATEHRLWEDAFDDGDAERATLRRAVTSTGTRLRAGATVAEALDALGPLLTAARAGRVAETGTPTSFESTTPQSEASQSEAPQSTTSESGPNAATAPTLSMATMSMAS